MPPSEMLGIASQLTWAKAFFSSFTLFLGETPTAGADSNGNMEETKKGLEHR